MVVIRVAHSLYLIWLIALFECATYVISFGALSLIPLYLFAEIMVCALSFAIRLPKLWLNLTRVCLALHPLKLDSFHYYKLIKQTEHASKAVYIIER